MAATQEEEGGSDSVEVVEGDTTMEASAPVSPPKLKADEVEMLKILGLATMRPRDVAKAIFQKPPELVFKTSPDERGALQNVGSSGVKAGTGGVLPGGFEGLRLRHRSPAGRGGHCEKVPPIDAGVPQGTAGRRGEGGGGASQTELHGSCPVARPDDKEISGGEKESEKAQKALQTSTELKEKFERLEQVIDAQH